jgi:hypothetical protein
MLEKQNQGPQCTACGSPMKLSAIEPSSTGQDLRTFSCPICKRVERHIIDSLVTEAWLEPQRTVKAPRASAVAHEIHRGQMVPKKTH